MFCFDASVLLGAQCFINTFSSSFLSWWVFNVNLYISFRLDKQHNNLIKQINNVYFNRAFKKYYFSWVNIYNSLKIRVGLSFKKKNSCDL